MAEKEYSFTQLETFDNCPRMYKFKYIDGIPESFEIIEAHFGKVVHKALEYLYSETGIVDLDDLIDYFVEAWEEEKELPIKIVRRNEYESQYIELGKDLLCNYYYSEYEEDPYETIETEKYFKLLLSKKYLYSGKIDRIAKDDKGVFHIIDFKTSKNIFGFEDEFKSLQIKAYGVSSLLDNDLDKVILHYKFLRYNEDIVSLLEKKNANKVIAGLTRKIDRIESSERFPPIKTGLCGWCRYLNECKSSTYVKVLSDKKYEKEEEFKVEEEDLEEEGVEEEKFDGSASQSCIQAIEKYIEYSEKNNKAKKLYPLTTGKSFELKGKQYGEYFTYQDSFIPEESIGKLLFKGRTYNVSVCSYNPKTGKVVFMSKSLKLPEIQPSEDGRFEVDLLWLYKQLKDVIDINSSQIELCFLNNFQLKPSQKIGEELKPTIEELLDKFQSKAVSNSSNMTMGYIWGPPGTGKTTACLTGLVDILLREDQNIVILAFTNAAVNVIFQSLLKPLSDEEKRRLRVKRILLWPYIEKALYEKSIITYSYLNPKSRELKNLILNELYKNELSEIELKTKDINSKIRSIELKLDKKIDLENIDGEKGRLSIKCNEIKTITQAISKISESIERIDHLIISQQSREPTLGERIFGGYKRKLEKMTSEKSRAICLYENLKEKLEKFDESEDQISNCIRDITKLILLREEYQKLINEKKKLLEEEMINKGRVFLGTFASTVSRLNSLPAEYHLIVDEASSAPSAWLLPFVVRAGKVTFLGDHMQLPTVYEGDENDMEMSSWLKSSVLELIRGLKDDNLDWAIGRAISLEKLKSNCNVSVLKKSYRLQQPLAKITDDLWYKIGLKGEEFFTLFPILLADTSKFGAYAVKEGTSRRNKMSAVYVAKLIKQKLISSSDVMIITPYRSQVKLYQRLLKESKIYLPVLTVHRAQGSEAKTVIFDVTDGRGLRPYFTLENKFGGAEETSNLLCVALTRSSETTIIVADKSFWLNKYPKSAISTWINEAKSLDEYFSFEEEEEREFWPERIESLESLPEEREEGREEKEEERDEKYDTLKVCGSCNWFELIKLTIGKCGSPSTSHNTVLAGDQACLAFKPKDKK